MSNDSCNSTKNKNVISKYFTKAGDESLEDFQESKKIINGPKNVKSAVKKPRKYTKKTSKQKDIRQALKGKKNELVEFTKEFNNVCEKTGIDVDSEQLQLAVALSKSLQSETVNNNSQKTQNTQERNRKIRATLQEYGFVVPEIKITTSRRIRKPRNQYKLISYTDTQKQEIITEKYSQVLLKGIIFENQSVINSINSHLFNLTTNILYENIKNNDVFYVNNLLEKSTTTFNLLRDWSEIPGRPVSPKVERQITDISAIEFSQNDLDVLLSGTLKSRDEIMGKIDIKEGVAETKLTENTHLDVISIEADNMTQQRCYSPDIFEDESTIIDKSRTSRITQDKDFSMDLTECVNQVTQVSKNIESLSQRNVTKRKSDDFMDMTECVSTSKTIVNKIDLTITNNEKENFVQVDVDKCNELNKNNLNNTIIIDVEEYSRKISNKSNELELLDLTQENGSPKLKSQSYFDDFHHDHSDSKENNVEATSILEVLQMEHCSQKDLDSHNIENEEIDLTQSSDTSVRNDDIDCENLANEIKNASKNNSWNNSDVNTEINEIAGNEIDLTQSSNSNGETSNPRCSTLGKIDNVSIDYDEVNNIDMLNAEKEIPSKTIATDIQELSQNSEIFEINDNELDYSLNKSRLDHFNKESYSNDLDDIIEIKDIQSPDKSEKKDEMESDHEEKSGRLNDELSLRNESPEREIIAKTIQTPKNDFIIKFDEVTPMQDYAKMSSPERNRELCKYGLKPLKRKRAIQLLTHLYNQTHPLIEELPTDIASPSKKRKSNSHSNNLLSTSPLKNIDNINETNVKDTNATSSERNSRKYTIKSPLKNSGNLLDASPSKKSKNSPKKSSQNKSPTKVAVISYEVTNEVPKLREVNCHPDEWVFQKREKAKVHTCRVPLHIAFHNYVSCRHGLREAILKYEPVNIDVIHKELVSYGHRYDPKDLLKFLDKKCITVKTTDHNTKYPKY